MLGRTHGGGHGNALQYFCLENSVYRGIPCLAGYSPWGRRESDMTEQQYFFFFKATVTSNSFSALPESAFMNCGDMSQFIIGTFRLKLTKLSCNMESLSPAHPLFLSLCG